MAGTRRAVRRCAAHRGADARRALSHDRVRLELARRAARAGSRRVLTPAEPSVANRLAGRRIAVIGAGTQPTDDPDAPIGNGRAIAVLAAREGATVACVDRLQEAAEDTAGLIESEGGSCSVHVANVASEDECNAM